MDDLVFYALVILTMAVVFGLYALANAGLI